MSATKEAATKRLAQIEYERAVRLTDIESYAVALLRLVRRHREQDRQDRYELLLAMACLKGNN